MKLKDLKVGDKFFFIEGLPCTFIKKGRRNKDGFCLIGTDIPFTDCLGWDGEAEVILLGE